MNKLFYSILAASALAVLPAQAYTVSVIAADSDATLFSEAVSYNAAYDPDIGQGGNFNAERLATIVSNVTSTTYADTDFGLLYKQNEGSGEEGSLTGSYSTTFNGDLSGSTTTYGSGTNADNSTWLIVKDGNNLPQWYVFDISTWNGTDDFNLENFWNGNDSNNASQNGAISHFSIWSGPGGGSTGGTTGGSTGGTTGGSTGGTTGGPQVPEPSTYAMFGMAFGMFAFLRYRSRKS